MNHIINKICRATFILCLVVFVVNCKLHLKKEDKPTEKEIKHSVETSTDHSKLNDEQLSSSIQETSEPNQLYQKCDSIWKSYRKRMADVDSIIMSEINHNYKISIANKRFLLALLKKNDSLLKIEKPISAVFQGLDSVPFIVSNYYWLKCGDGYKAYATDKKILKKHDTVSYDFESEKDISRFLNDWNSRKYFPNAVLELNKKLRSLYVYSKNRTYKSEVNSIGVQNSECDSGYIFYNFSYEGSSDNLLIASPFLIELDFGNWNDKDKIIHDQSINNCFDCPHSHKLVKTFAKLRGTKNIYFAYAGEKNNIEDLDTPIRSLVYIDESNYVYDIWNDEIDLFGCGCL